VTYGNQKTPSHQGPITGDGQFWARSSGLTIDQYCSKLGIFFFLLKQISQYAKSDGFQCEHTSKGRCAYLTITHLFVVVGFSGPANVSLVVFNHTVQLAHFGVVHLLRLVGRRVERTFALCSAKTVSVTRIAHSLVR